MKLKADLGLHTSADVMGDVLGPGEKTEDDWGLGSCACVIYACQMGYTIVARRGNPLDL